MSESARDRDMAPGDVELLNAAWDALDAAVSEHRASGVTPDELDQLIGPRVYLYRRLLGNVHQWERPRPVVTITVNPAYL